MIGTGGARTRVLVADPDASRRQARRTDLGDEFAVAESVSAEETLAWLLDQEPGITLLDLRLPGAGGAEIVARIRDLHPDEVVVILAPDLSLGLCRAAMRAGAHDCLDLNDLHPERLIATCEAAAARILAAGRSGRQAEDLARAAVRRHEREAAGRLAKSENLSAWQAVDAGVRQRWVRDYLRAVEDGHDGEREHVLAELAREMASLERPGALLAAVHVHAAASARPAAADEAMDRARECLVEALAKVAEVRTRPAPLRITTGGTVVPEPRLAARTWHRWRMPDRAEEWCLVVDGKPVARLSSSSAAEGCRGLLHRTVDGPRLEAVDLPPIPEALREVERRLGLPYVLSVESAAAT